MTRTIEDDLRDYGEAFEINGERIDPTSVEIFANLVTYCTPDGRHTQCPRSEVKFYSRRVNRNLGRPYVPGVTVTMVTPPPKDAASFYENYRNKLIADIAKAYRIDIEDVIKDHTMAEIAAKNAKLYLETPSGEVKSIGEVGKLSFPSISGEHVKALRESGSKFTMSGTFEPTEEWQAFVKSVRREALYRWLDKQVPTLNSVSYHALMVVGGF